MYESVVLLPWYGVLTYTPSILLVMPAAYASSQFAAHHSVFPFPFNIMLGIAFEWMYAGTIALAGNKKRSKWYIAVIITGAITSVIYITLHAASMYGLLDRLSDWRWLLFFSVIHALPIAVLNVMYMTLHNLAKTNEQHRCICGKLFTSKDALNGHSGHCKGLN